MASSVACLVSFSFLSRVLLRPMRHVAPFVSRSFGSSALPQDENNRSDHHLEVDHRSDDTMRRYDYLFSEVFNPFSPTHSLREVLNMMDQFTDNSFPSAKRSDGVGFHCGWDAKETDDALHLRIDMPRLDKENVKVYVEQNTLTIKGEKDNDDAESIRTYSSKIDLPEKVFKIDEIKAEMRNGVLKVVVPKFAEEDRNDVFKIKIK